MEHDTRVTMLDICGDTRNNNDLFNVIRETNHTIRFIRLVSDLETSLIDHYSVKYTRQGENLPKSKSKKTKKQSVDLEDKRASPIEQYVFILDDFVFDDNETLMNSSTLIEKSNDQQEIDNSSLQMFLKKLMSKPHVIVLSSKLIIDVLSENKPIPQPDYPLYCFKMKNVKACIGCVQNEERLTRIIRHMGGSVTKDIQVDTTHLISNVNSGDCYLRAVSYGHCRIVSELWVEKCWSLRNKDDWDPNSQDMLVKHRIKIFGGLVFRLLGFDQLEHEKISKQAQDEGAIVITDENVICTHIILKNSNVFWTIDQEEPVFVVFVDWFTDSLSVSGRLNERIYMVNRNYEPLYENNRDLSKIDHRKRKKSIRDTSSVTESPKEMSAKRRRKSSRVSGFQPDDRDERNLEKSRKPRIMEVKTTEKNYVQVLELLAEMKDDLSERAGSREQMLHLAFIDQIFKSIIPLYMLHMEIYADLERLMRQQNPSPVVLSNIFVSRANDFLSAYQPFVRCYEETNELISKLRKEKPEFDRYVKEFESDIRCRKLRISDLLIRPIQRIPSVILLMTAIQQYCNKHSPDFMAMGECVNTLKRIAENLNSEKAKSSNWKAVLLIANCVDGCPHVCSVEDASFKPTLSSKSRSFVREVSLLELTDCMIGEGSNIVLFMFEDCLEFARMRPQGFFKSSILGGSRSSSLSTSDNKSKKTSSTLSLFGNNQAKQMKKRFKHLLNLKLLHVIRVHLFRQYRGNKDAFGLTYADERVMRSAATTESFEKTLIFYLVEGHGISLDDFVSELTQHVLAQRCLTNTDGIFVEEKRTAPIKMMGRSHTLVQRMKTQIHRGLSRVFSMQERRIINRTFTNEQSRKRPPPPQPTSCDESDTENKQP